MVRANHHQNRGGVCGNCAGGPRGPPKTKLPPVGFFFFFKPCALSALAIRIIALRKRTGCTACNICKFVCTGCTRFLIWCVHLRNCVHVTGCTRLLLFCNFVRTGRTRFLTYPTLCESVARGLPLQQLCGKPLLMTLHVMCRVLTCAALCVWRFYRLSSRCFT